MPSRRQGTSILKQTPLPEPSHPACALTGGPGQNSLPTHEPFQAQIKPQKKAIISALDIFCICQFMILS